ncbi:MAG: hypothetical protein O7D91_17610 [Planctomycetota bacterium]|nr:hypothetical protein [Planctomycetota bacterium]
MIDLDNAAKVLNEFLEADQVGCNIFFSRSVGVNHKVCIHPTILVADATAVPGYRLLSPLGLINGLVGDNSDRVLVKHMDDRGKLLKFTVGTLKEGKVTP